MKQKEWTCKNCFHAHKSETELNQYFCRRFPPTVLGVPIPAQGGLQIVTQSVFPAVTGDLSCGQWEENVPDLSLV